MSSQNREIVDFFDTDYRWWDGVYEQSLPRGFLSFEMIKRRELLVEMLDRYGAHQAGLRLLECGCGPGGIVQGLDRQRERLTALDINFRHLSKAREELGGEVRWLQGDVEHLPFGDRSFDLVYCVGVLSYLQEDEPAIAEIARVVKPGGVVIFALPNWLMLNMLFDPYYYLAWPALRLAARLVAARDKAASQGFSGSKIRRYRYRQIKHLWRQHGLLEQERVNVSFGPLTIWRRELLPLRLSIRLSEALLAVGKRKGFSFLRHCTNHWIACLSKVTA